MSSPSSFPYKKIVVLTLWLATWTLVGQDFLLTPLWPSILGLLSVLLLRKVITGLLIGGSAGAILLNNGHPLKAFMALFAIRSMSAGEVFSSNTGSLVWASP